MFPYKLATDDLTVHEGIDLILDAACGVLDFDKVTGEPTDESLFGGFVLSLGALLSSDERPADLILLEACAGSSSADAENPRSKPDYGAARRRLGSHASWPQVYQDAHDRANVT